MRIKSKLLYKDQNNHLTGIQEMMIQTFLSFWIGFIVLILVFGQPSLTDQQINAYYEQDMRREIHLTDYQIKYLQEIDKNN